MANIVEDLKELPKDEPKLQKWSVYSLLLCVIVSIVMAVWYLIRLQNSGANSDQPSWLWSIVHLVAYIAYAGVSGCGLYGAYYPKPKFIGWYLIGSLIVVIAEVVCLFWNQIVVADKYKKFSFLTLIIKVLAIIVFVITTILGFLWKRYVDNHPIKSAVLAAKSDHQIEKAKADIKGNTKC